MAGIVDKFGIAAGCLDVKSLSKGIGLVGKSRPCDASVVNVAAIQFDIAWHDRAKNFDTVRRLLARETGPTDLIVLPEMFDVGFSMNVDAAIEPDDRPTATFLAEMAKAKSAAVLAGVARRDSTGQAANQAVLIDAGGREIACYTKTHLFSPAGEDRAFHAGSSPTVIEFHGTRIALLVCYDLRFPERFRDAVDLGAEVFFLIANWPVRRVEHWFTLARARAIENQAYVVAVNRIGSDPSSTYPGRSIVVDPKGTIVADAGDRETVLRASIDVEFVRSWRAEFPALRDRVVRK